MTTFITGVGLGVVAGLLFAPKSGDLTRADLREWSSRVIDGASGTMSQVKPGRATKKSPASEITTGIRERSKHAVEILNSATRDALIAVRGVGQVLAGRIIENRPYERAYEVVQKGFRPESLFLQLR
jgi:gas vesicle protein